MKNNCFEYNEKKKPALIHSNMEYRPLSSQQSNSLIRLVGTGDQGHANAFLATLKGDPGGLINNAENIARHLGKGTCVEKNDPTPAKFVTERIRIMLQRIVESDSKYGTKDKKKMQLALIRATVQSYDKIAEAKHASVEAAVRDIKTQVMLRLQYWASLGNTFARMYKKLKLTRNKKPKKLSHQNSERTKEEQRNSTKQFPKLEAVRFLYKDIIDLLTICAMKLPQAKPFPSFLRECLDKSFVQREPASLLPKKVFQQIFDNFEVKDPEVMTSEDVILFTQTMLPKGKKKRQSLQREALQCEKSVEPINPPTTSSKNQGLRGDKKSHNSLTSQALGILAPGTRKKNSLFVSGDASGHRSSYVGSHFNTNLVNTSSLFREVKMPKKNTALASNARVAIKHPPSSTTLDDPRHQSYKRSHSHAALNNSKSGPQGSKRKLLNCFQTVDTTTSASKAENFNLVGKRAQKEAPLRSNIGQGLGVDIDATRRVVAAARTALKRQS